MTTHFISQISDSYGVLLRREAVEAGVDDNALRRLVDGDVLIRMRHGAYALREQFLAADTRLRHAMLCRAVTRQYGDHVALSHASSAVFQGGPDWGLDLSSAHVTHLHGGGRKLSRVVHHAGDCRVDDLRKHQGRWVTVPARAALEIACLNGAEAGLVQANHFLHSGEATVEQLIHLSQVSERWPGSLAHHPVLFLANAKIESVGETRSFYLMWTQGLPLPKPQFEIFHPDGRLAGRVDFAWPALKLIVEFDGMAKYHRYRREGESIEAMVAREKKREDLLRELTGWTVIRIIWADLGVPAHTAARIRRAFTPY